MLNVPLDSIKKILITLILGIGVTFFLEVETNAITCDRYKIVNDDMRKWIGDTDEEVKFEAWHHAAGNNKAGYWKFKRNDKNFTKTIYDDEVLKYFSGTSKLLPGGIISVTYNLPSQAKKFISIYGADKLGLKINIGKDGSIQGNKISYDISNDKINIKFYGVLNYVRPNMWQTLNPGVANQMNQTVYTPQVKDGYGDNRISIGSSYGGGSIKLDENIVRNAKRIRDWLYVGGEKSLWATFTNGGNNGIIFRFPIKIDYYDNRAYTETPQIKSSTYNGWVKVGNVVEVRQVGSTNRDVPLVKINSNFLELNKDGNVSLINSRILHYSNESKNYTLSGDANIQDVYTYRDREKTISDYKIKVNNEGTYSIRGYSDLTHYRNDNLNDPMIYRESSWSGGVTFKGDGKAPTGNSKINYDSDTNKLRVNINNVSDNGGSGVKKVWLHITDRKNNVPAKDIELKSDYSGNYIYENNASDILNNKAAELKVEVYTEDNVGNTDILNQKDIDILKLNSRITRDLAPHDPIFFTRECGTVTVNLTGYFDRVKIVFPDELSELSLDKNIEKKLEYKLEYKFKIPEKAKNKEYKVKVIGYKGTRTMESNPTLKIQGNIQDELRTRIRTRGVEN